MADHELIIPVTGESLGDFLLSLLGQPRTIERSFVTSRLLIDYQMISSVIETIIQRVSQNRSAMPSFKCLYYYSNRKVHTVYSLEDFRHYSDNSLNESTGLDINMTFLVDLPDSPQPKKQEIRLQFFSDAGVQYELRSDT